MKKYLIRVTWIKKYMNKLILFNGYSSNRTIYINVGCHWCISYEDGINPYTLTPLMYYLVYRPKVPRKHTGMKFIGKLKSVIARVPIKIWITLERYTHHTKSLCYMTYSMNHRQPYQKWTCVLGVTRGELTYITQGERTSFEHSISIPLTAELLRKQTCNNMTSNSYVLFRHDGYIRNNRCSFSFFFGLVWTCRQFLMRQIHQTAHYCVSRNCSSYKRITSTRVK